jgi:hypothetical protein
MRRPLVVLLVLAAPGLAQRLLVGLKGGVPATVYFETGRSGSRVSSAEYSAATRRYTVGVAAEWRPTRSLGLECDVLYHRMGYVGITQFFSGPTGVLTTSSFDVKGHTWDFPLLVKRRFGRAVRPYAAGGAALRYVGPVRARGEVVVQNLITQTTTRSPLDTASPSDLRKRLYPGFVMAGGVELGRGRFRVLPEFRWTHWTANISRAGGLLRFHPNQAEFLLGLLF